MRPRRFLLFDGGGSLLWAGTFLDWASSSAGEIEVIAEHAVNLGGWLLVILIAAFVSYIWLQIYCAPTLHAPVARIGRITVEELKTKIDAEEDMVIVDLRHASDFEADPETIPGLFEWTPRN